MAHLLIDTVKTSVAGKFLPASRHTVRLFAGKRTAKPLRRLLRVVQNSDGLPPPIALTELPRKKDVPAAILDQARAILAADPQANIAVVSPRGKLRRKLDKLQTRYPDAQIFSAGKLGKKTRAFLAQETAFVITAPETDKTAHRPSENPPAGTEQPERPSENPTAAPSPAAAEAELINRAAENVQAAAAAVLPPAAAEAELINRAAENVQAAAAAVLPPAASDLTGLEQALRLLHKNRPKKKAALLAMLARQHGGGAEELFAALIKNGNIAVDAAETVRYIHP
ncbi:hypothetical protein [Neisseria bacilliformis]|nr:hypothetical protein [Neisseria bacilliformis]QMT47500.1 hypothetical protein H3L91_11615 [Neisseria bacilliformis]